ncbi:LOW QUALITY PROTEIN: uncharacterized protein Dere_GG27140 [Drosophila erecta]|uniref:Uncharacterized protein n=1 Tax=Drosophila erecta TaxID=7220 RepID=A0A0Q5TJR2_DROER|nr:LOW QUALITY PROTEIN: uncharacterized protein Dere_GG27140 [Drosophila erecta]
MRCVGNRTYAIERLQIVETKSVQRKTGYQKDKKEACKPSAINYFHGNAPRAVAFWMKCSLKSRSAARWGAPFAILHRQPPISNVQSPNATPHSTGFDGLWLDKCTTSLLSAFPAKRKTWVHLQKQ